ncbi:SafA/ExsA family spore coat assembly protein [Paraliobacillus sediminis]|uniref:SafA/ExsA family spore coat assembly protein n=1 Tax=Paraliobacillus sediminis TaxID=1885916 RepID=UPI000E3CDCFA|nr:SafA/ExsA family spore coat assembly protein [Paraliobacillus sediminis]
MKIHIVQKGDTLWNLAQKYGVNFEEVKQLNAQLADPNQIMPGMKIKIPTSTKQVQQPVNDKTMHPYKDTSKKAQPVMYEDDTKKTTQVKKQMPVKAEPMPMPQPIQLPNLPNFYSTNYNIDVDIEDNDTEISQHNFHYMEQPTQQQPVQKPVQQQMPPQPMPQPMQPAYHMMQPCMPCMPPMQHMPCPPQHMPSLSAAPIDPCQQFQSPQSLMHGQQQPPVYQGYEAYDEMESSSIEMPPMPNQYTQQPAKWEMNPGMYGVGQQGNAPMAQQNMMPNGFNQSPPPNGMNMPQGMPQGMQPGMQMPDQPFYPTQQGDPGMMPPQMGSNMPFQPMRQMGSPYPYRMTEDDEGNE